MELQRLAGAAITRLSCSFCYVFFLPMLARLQHLELLCCEARGECGGLHGAPLDLGSLHILKHLHVLHIGYGDFDIRYLERLPHLKELRLTDIGPASADQQPAHAFCQLPPSLTQLQMINWDWYDHIPAASVRPVLEQFGGQLRSLTLNPQFMKEFGNNVADLSTLRCLQPLQELKVAVIGAPQTPGGLLGFPCLRTLEVQISEWPAQRRPHWDLTGCTALQKLSLVFNDDDESRVGVPIDLRGISCSQGLCLHLKLDVPSRKRAYADFAGWSLEAVIVQSYTAWRKMQSMQDLLGALICHIPASRIKVNDALLQAPGAG